MFDVGPALAAQSGGSTGSAYLFWDYIDNFQPGVDQIAFINAPGEFISYSTANGFVSDPIGNPLVADGVATAEGGHFIGPTGGQVDWRYVVAAPDTAMGSTSVTISHDSTITLLNGTQYTLPQDPWLLS